jgi:hypothetical protein
LWLFKKLNPSLDLQSFQSGTLIWLPVIAEAGAEPAEGTSSGIAMYPAYYEPMLPSRMFQMLTR